MWTPGAYGGGLHKSLVAGPSKKQSCWAPAPHVNHQGGRVRLSSGICRARRERDLYELLGVEPEASEDDIKTAFRRRAKELHPDVNGDDSTQSFIEVQQAYETLSDPSKRREYDRTHGFRRLGFFRDVEVEPGGWGRRAWRTSARPGDEDDEGDEGVGSDFNPPRRTWGTRPRSSEEDGHDAARAPGMGWGDFGGMSEREAAARRQQEAARRRRQAAFQDQDEEEGEGGEDDDDDEEGPLGDEGPSKERLSDAERDAKRLEEIMRVLQQFGPGGLASPYGGGRGDPFGVSTSDSWRRRTQEQMRNPLGGSRGSDWGRGGGGMEWNAPGRRGFGDGEGDVPPGWMPPGRGPEWRPPGRYPDDDDDGRGGRGGRGPGRGGGGRRGWGDDDGFRGKPL